MGYVVIHEIDNPGVTKIVADLQDIFLVIYMWRETSDSEKIFKINLFGLINIILLRSSMEFSRYKLKRCLLCVKKIVIYHHHFQFQCTECFLVVAP